MACRRSTDWNYATWWNAALRLFAVMAVVGGYSATFAERSTASEDLPAPAADSAAAAAPISNAPAPEGTPGDELPAPDNLVAPGDVVATPDGELPAPTAEALPPGDVSEPTAESIGEGPLVVVGLHVTVDEDAAAAFTGRFLQRQGDEVAEASLRHRVLVRKEAVVGAELQLAGTRAGVADEGGAQPAGIACRHPAGENDPGMCAIA